MVQEFVLGLEPVHQKRFLGRIGVFEENGQDSVYEGVLLDGIKSLDEGGEMFGMKLAVEVFEIPVVGQIILADLGIATVSAMKVVEPSFFLSQRMNQINQSLYVLPMS